MRLPQSVVVLVGHGSRISEGNEEFEDLVCRVRATSTDVDVRHGYIERASPLLGEALLDAAGSYERVIVLPVILFRAGHVIKDIPSAIEIAAKEFPSTKIICGREIGPDPVLVEIAFERIAPLLTAETSKRGPAVLICMGRGSSNPQANRDFRETANSLGKRSGIATVMPCFSGITEPRLGETVELALRGNAPSIVVAPFFLFDGVLVRRIRDDVRRLIDQNPGVAVSVANHLGVHDRLVELLCERINALMKS